LGDGYKVLRNSGPESHEETRQRTEVCSVGVELLPTVEFVASQDALHVNIRQGLLVQVPQAAMGYSLVEWLQAGERGRPVLGRFAEVLEQSPMPHSPRCVKTRP